MSILSDQFLIEAISISLVREFLKRKGLVVTYQTLEEECPKDEHSITNRTQLAKCLRIEKLLKQNKACGNYLKTMLEVIAQYLMECPMMYENKEENTIQTSVESPPADNRLVIEDELETETVVGHGMDHIMQTVASNGANGTEEYHHRQRRPRPPRSTYHHPQVDDTTQQQPEIPVHTPSQLTAGQHEYPDKRVVACDNPYNNTQPSPPNTSNSTASPATSDLADVEGAASHTSSEDNSDSTRPTSKQSIPCHILPSNEIAPPLIVASPDRSDVAEPQTCTEGNISSVEPPSPVHEPKPPARVPEYIGNRLKRGDVENTIQLLRQRRRVLQRQASSADESGRETVEEKPDSQEEQIDHTEDKRVDATEPSADEEQEEGAQCAEEEDSYSPRIVYPPLEDKIPVTCEPDQTQEAIPNKTEEVKQPETKVVKQPVQYLPVKETITMAKVIDIQTAMELKKLVLGSSSLVFPEHWMVQNLGFCDLTSCLYGLVQHRAGTSGLMAVVQAVFLMELLFVNPANKNIPSDKRLYPRSAVRSNLLAVVIAKILWRCGEGKRATLALPGNSTMIAGGGRFKSDGITETFEDDGSNGAILLLYSIILSRGIELVLDDMDCSDTTLITQEGHCSQELINLLLCGKAASNIFNDCMEITVGLGNTMLLKGIPTRCDIGLLSIREHTNRRIQVGTFMKTPKYPIWVVELESSRYAVVFCLNKDLISDWRAERRFDLLYYDTQGTNDQDIKLTLDTTSRFFTPPDDDDQVPPIELCLRTKWRDAQVDWNGTDPIFDSRHSVFED